MEPLARARKYGENRVYLSADAGRYTKSLGGQLFTDT